MKTIAEPLITATEYQMAEGDSVVSGRAIVAHVLRRNGIDDLMSVSWQSQPQSPVRVVPLEPISAKRAEPWWRDWWRASFALAIGIAIIGIRLVIVYGI